MEHGPTFEALATGYNSPEWPAVADNGDLYFVVTAGDDLRDGAAMARLVACAAAVMHLAPVGRRCRGRSRSSIC